MKKNIALLLLGLLTLLQQSFAGVIVTPGDEQSVDSRLVARALALRPADSYSFRAYMQFGQKPDGDYRYDSLEGKMLLDGRIASLWINNLPILSEGEEPLGALPIPAGGADYFQISLSGMQGGSYVSWGDAYSQTGIRDGDSVEVTMLPANMDVLVPFKLPAGVSAGDVEIITDGWMQGYYNFGLGGFVVGVNLLTTPSYEVRNRFSKVVYQRGTIDPFGEDQSTNDPGSVVNIRYAGGVVDLPFTGNSFFYFEKQRLNGQTTIGGKTTRVQTFMTTTLKRHRLVFEVSGIKGTLHVQSPTTSGEMPDVVPPIHSTPNQWNGHRIELDLPVGQDSLILSIVPDDGQEDVEFSVWVSENGFRG